jgi:DNA modification methylase
MDDALYFGDCLDVARRMPNSSVNLVLTDPPYTSDNTASAGTRYRSELNHFDDSLPTVLEFKKDRNHWHPYRKPVALFETIIRNTTNEGQVVFDMFAGGGTTLEACRALGRRCLMAEKSEEYCKRISQDSGIEITRV